MPVGQDLVQSRTGLLRALFLLSQGRPPTMLLADCCLTSMMHSRCHGHSLPSHLACRRSVVNAGAAAL